MIESAPPNFLAALGLDGKLFLAQLINFSVILFVMWKWVYTPLLNTLDERTKKIARGLADAEEARSLKQTAETDKQQAVSAARKEAKSIIEDARVVVMRERETMLATAKEEVGQIIAQGKEQILADKNAAIRAAKAELGDVVIAAVEKIAREKIDPHKDAKLLQELLQ